MIEARIKATEPMTVAFLQMHGSYEETPLGYQRLYETVDHYGLRPVGPPHALYVTDPRLTPAGQAEWELWAPIAGGAGTVSPEEDGFGVKRVEAKTVAATMHQGPYEGLAETYSQLESWVAEQGYDVVGPPEEVYLSEPETAPEETLTEVTFPVQRR